VLDRVLAPLARRLAWVRTALRMQHRYEEVHGSFLASAVTLAAFVSIFPLLLVGIAVLGLVSAGNADLPAQVLRTFGLSAGDTAGKLILGTIGAARKSHQASSILGLAGMLWSGLGLVAATQFALDSVWQVADRGIKDKLLGLGWLVGSTALLLASFAITGAMNFLPAVLDPLAVVIGLAWDVGLWLFTFKLLTNRDVGWRPLLPGAILGAVGLQVLKALGSIYVPRAVASSTALYGSIGVVFAILAWLFLFGRLIVYSAALNVVRWEEDHGTVTAEIEMPRLPGQAPAGATRAGEAVPVPAAAARASA
jgi:membrane protein